jgi:hypothetical protein
VYWIVRAVLGVIGLVVALSGLYGLSLGGQEAFAGAWGVIVGLALVAVALLEVRRYRSEAAEQTQAPLGPGAGETSDAPLDPRFQPTAEVFIDPSTRRTMRVLIDPATGERRYVAED